MIIWHTPQESIFDSGCEALVSPVNALGFSGAGLALEIANRFPDSEKLFRLACPIQIGNVVTVDANPYADCETRTLAAPNKIIYCPTKYDYRHPSKISVIDRGLMAIVIACYSLYIRSVAIPALGCGLGRLKWDRVKAKMELRFSTVESITFHVYPPYKSSDV